MNFEEWLASILGQESDSVGRLLKDDAALHFLIAWSLFESKCFNGFVKSHEMRSFARRFVEVDNFDPCVIMDAARHFHERYQDAQIRKNLIRKTAPGEMIAVLSIPLDLLPPEDTLFLCLFTANRFRNNIFHGTKRVDSWLAFRTQIIHCTDVLQAVVAHAETRNPSLLMTGES